jgi:hypothetical protein
MHITHVQFLAAVVAAAKEYWVEMEDAEDDPASGTVAERLADFGLYLTIVHEPGPGPDGVVECPRCGKDHMCIIAREPENGESKT